MRRGRGRPRDPETDDRITSAAAELLLQRGFDRTTVDDVATRAGVGKATVYRRWPSKEDLAVAAMETLYSAEMPEPDTGDIRRDLAASYRSVLAFVNTPDGRGLPADVDRGVGARRPDRRAAPRVDRAPRGRLPGARSSGPSPAARCAPDIDVDSAVQWLGGLLAIRAITHRPMPAIEDADTLVEFTLRGVGA